jgi:hypothetical protein
MKKLILATAVTAGVITYFMGDTDQPVEDNAVLQNPTQQGDSMGESTVTTAAQVASSDAAVSTDSSMPSTSTDGQGYSSYNQDYNALENERVSNSYNSRYNDESNSYSDEDYSSSYSDSSSEDYSSSDSSSSYSSSSTDNDNNTDSNDSNDTDKEEELPTEKFQRIYDNGIVWYGDYGTLNVQYQSSNAETTGIGIRIHYDNLSVKVTSISPYQQNLIGFGSPDSPSPDDVKNFDNNVATNVYIPIAWADFMDGKWPQTTQLAIATIEFERLNNGANNYNIDYSITSNAAGYQFVK